MHTQITYQTSFVQRYTHGQQTHTLTHTHLPRAKQSPCTSHLIPFIAQRKDSSVTNAPVLAEASGNSQSFCCFRASCLCLITLTLCTYPLLCSLFLSFLLPLSSPVFLSLFLLLTLFLLPCSLICLFPLSSVCTMHINYSEAVSRFLRLIQSEPGSALMGSCCTCYRLQHTLETAGGGGGGERNRQREQRRQPRRREDERKR